MCHCKECGRIVACGESYCKDCVDELVECELCGGEIGRDTQVPWVCDDCANHIRRVLVHTIGKNFNSKEIDVLEYLFKSGQLFSDKEVF